MLLGEEFIKLGHKLRVFAPYIRSANRWWHHRIIGRDEEFVIRCYEELEPETLRGGSLEREKIRAEGLDVLIIESYNSVPYLEIGRLAEELKGEVKMVLVVHEGDRRDIRYPDLDVFDRIVVFDKRYVEEMLYDRRERVEIIPYPCCPPKEGKRRFAEDRLIFFSFGRQPVEEYEAFIDALDGLSAEYAFLYRVVRADGLLPFKRKWLIQHKGRLSVEEIYRNLHFSDIHLLPKGNTRKVVVSSAASQCLGALVPIVAPRVRYFENLPPGVIVLYEDREDLLRKLRLLIENEGFRAEVLQRAREYVEENRSDRIARRILDLIHSIGVQ